MNFDLSEDQRLLQRTLDDFLASESPIARVRELFDRGEETDPAVWKGMAGLGFVGLHLPGPVGGAGLELLDLVCVAERLGYHATPGPFVFNAVAGIAIALGGSDAQRERWLPGLARGECIASVAFAEEGDRWQPEQWRLAPDANGRLRGRKESVPCVGCADLVVVGLSGGALGIVEPDAPGVTRAGAHGIDRTRRIGSLAFDGAACELLPDGAAVSDRVRDAALVLLAADASGGASRCVDISVAYAGQREQFGRKIGEFQAVKHQLANLALAAEPCRALV